MTTSKYISITGLFAALCLSLPAGAQTYPAKLEGRAKFICDYLQDVIYGHDGRKLDQLDRYITAGYIEHNTRFAGVGLEHKRQSMANSPAFGPKTGCGEPKVILDSGNYVLFLREMKSVVDGKEVVRSQFDLFRFEGDKIAEHWD